MFDDVSAYICITAMQQSLPGPIYGLNRTKLRTYAKLNS